MRRVALLLVSASLTLATCSSGTPAATGGLGASAAGAASPTATSRPTASLAQTATVAPSASAAGAWELPSTAALSDAVVAKLQAALDGWAGQSDVPGLTAAVVSPQGSWAGAAGVDAAGTTMKADSAFSIASVTKTFVAAEILLLASQAKVDLDAPVTQYVDLPFDTKEATVRQLATMTSGFPGFVADATLDPLVAKDLLRVWTALDIVDLSKNEPLMGTLGGPSAYNGLNYVVLGLVIEKVTRQPLASVLRQNLLAPAGLDRVWTQPDEKPAAPLTIAVDPSTGSVVDPASAYLPSLAAASTGRGGAGMAADAPSLARWGYLLYGGDVIDPALVATMESGDPHLGDGYGFGTMLADIDGARVVGHAGDFMGFSGILLVWPNTKTAVVILAPRQGATLDGTLGGWATSLYQTLMAG